jgi:hypothetical protein
MHYFESIGNNKSLMKVSDMERIMEQKQAEVIKINEQKSKVDKRADFYS